jgi:hypothetical protein
MRGIRSGEGEGEGEALDSVVSGPAARISSDAVAAAGGRGTRRRGRWRQDL